VIASAGREIGSSIGGPFQNEASPATQKRAQAVCAAPLSP
jgi:hypothetical protein